ncbi:hypothetical protein Tsubulata_030464 [Turnera subulata]|uniref:SCP domain-containing protein n=1 Tax=Turnera subulata TaxID=218843 RepID=A0A9Q0FV76_9ROSI|nr:hypothetical protein Tsubulata_030464 [Turnera subulata]
MELTVIATTLCICFSVLLSPSAAAEIQAKSSLLENAARDGIHFPLPIQPRKLRLFENVAVKAHAADQGFTSFNKQKQDVSGKADHKQQNVMHGGKAAGTWHEWVEGTDTSQFFTMDYSHVRRRRPIHNKSLPVGP